jgi:hypothetical protein
MMILLQHLFGALPAVQYTEGDAQQMRARGAVHPLEGGAIPQRDARQQSGKVFVGGHGGEIEPASVTRTRAQADPPTSGVRAE